jgi:OPA family glycerol-3-phosphate transporter-like MFS transporter
MSSILSRIFAPAPHRPLLPEPEIQRRYPRLRMQVLQSTFLGYASYYLVRNNFSTAAKDLNVALHYTDSMVGNIMAVSALSYGLGKFLLGALSDRSNPRVFMATGLVLSAICNVCFGFSRSYPIHLFLWTINGFVQGMGWPPCGRSMGHWFSERERGLTFSTWNTSHNVGGGIAGVIAGWAVNHFGAWQYAFFVPAGIALVMAVYLYLTLVDTPQSCGLPPIEVYKNDFVHAEADRAHHERELSFKELFLKYVLLNKFVWILAIANFFVYISRYSMLDWSPKYVREMKGTDVKGGGLAILFSEFGGIPSTILFGWLSDRIGGRRGAIMTLCMIPIIFALAAMMYVTSSPRFSDWSTNTHLYFDYAMLTIIGFFIYPVVNMLTIVALDLTSKKAIGTAAGFIGLFGYLGRMTQASGFGQMLDHFKKTADVPTAWQMVFYSILGCTVAAFALLALTWTWSPRTARENQ